MTVIVGPAAPGEDGPIPVVVDGDEYGPAARDFDAFYEDEEAREGTARRVIRAGQDVYGEGLDLARRCASQAMRRLSDLGDGLRPDEIELQVGITFEAGMAAVVRAGAQAQIQVTFRWQPGDAAAPATTVTGTGTGA
ncbi:CU044_2847 family protein [Streptomyces sp. NPDC058231]|uniref:CU044_2847 family protein n=1 Tax=Streptomyces sp. NPDC058231 TaxID=3346392 RepID=UPI0036E48927